MSSKSARRVCGWLPLAALILLNAGCGGYRLGSMLPGDIKSVFVPTVENTSNEPLLEAEVTQAILQQLQRDGSLAIASEDTADAILRVVVTNYELEPVSYRQDVRAAANQYRIRMTAQMEMRRTTDQSVVAESPRIVGTAVFDVVGDLSSSKRRGNPLAAIDLADRIIQRLVEYW